MAKTKEKDNTLEHWKAEIRRGISYQNVFGERKKWATYVNYYLGNWKPGVYPVNKTFSMLRSLIPRVYFRNPKVLMTGTRPEYEAKAVVNQAVANLLIKKMKLKQTCKKIIQDAFFCNRGIVKMGYDTQFGALPHLGKKQAPTDEKLEYSSLVQAGMPWALRTNPENFIVPWGTIDLDTNPRWAAHKVERLLEDVKKDTIYQNTKDLKGSYVRKIRGKAEKQEGISEHTKSSQDDTAKEYQGRQAQWVDIWEIRDFKMGTVLALNMNHNKYLRNPVKDTLQRTGIPFVDVCFNPDNDVYWGPSDVKILRPYQEELNETRTQMSESRKINLIRVLFDSELISQEEFNKLMSGEVGAGLAIPGLKRDAVIALQIGEPLGLRADSMDIERDMNEVVGFPRTQQGEYAGPPRKTKFEVQETSQGHWIRVDERRDIVADFIVNVVRKALAICHQEWTSPQVIPVVGRDNAMHWVRYTGRDLVGEFEFEIDMDTGKPHTTEGRLEDAEKLWARFQQRPDLVNERELAKNVLKLYDWIDVDTVLAAPMPRTGPMQAESMEQFSEQQFGISS